jgi:hypothetical protein
MKKYESESGTTLDEANELSQWNMSEYKNEWGTTEDEVNELSQRCKYKYKWETTVNKINTYEVNVEAWASRITSEQKHK